MARFGLVRFGVVFTAKLRSVRREAAVLLKTVAATIRFVLVGFGLIWILARSGLGSVWFISDLTFLFDLKPI